MPTEDEDELIAKNDLGELQRCDCGGVNLTLGSVTLHFAAAEVGPLYELVAAARGTTETASDGNVTPLRRKGKGKTLGSLH